MIVLTVLSQKGGVGKTITVANLAAAFALEGLRVLMVDFDPQSDLSASWGIGDDEDRLRVDDVLLDPEIAVEDALIDLTPPGAPALKLLPASRRLRTLTSRLLSGDMGELSRLLDATDGPFDLVVIDTPAGETVFGAQAIRASHETIVTLLPGYNEIRALHRVLDDIDAQADQVGVDLGLLGVLLVNVDPRWKSTREYAAALRDEDVALLETIIPRRVGVTAHARYGRPTILLEPDSRVGCAYRDTAREVLGRLQAHHGLRFAASDQAGTGPSPERSPRPTDGNGGRQ